MGRRRYTTRPSVIPDEGTRERASQEEGTRERASQEEDTRERASQEQGTRERVGPEHQPGQVDERQGQRTTPAGIEADAEVELSPGAYLNLDAYNQDGQVLNKIYNAEVELLPGAYLQLNKIYNV